MNLTGRTVLATLIFASASGLAHAADVQHYTLHDKSIVAEFQSVDPNCVGAYGSGIITYVSVQSGFQTTRTLDPNPDAADCHGAGCDVMEPLVSVTISVWSNCESTRLLFAQGFTSNQDLKIDPNLNSGTLDADVPVTNSLSLNTFPAHLHLSWDGAGRTSHSSYNDVEHSGGVAVATHSEGVIRDAVATGSVTIDGASDAPFPSSHNYTPSPSTSAVIQKNGFSQVTITPDAASNGAMLATPSEATPAARATWGRIKQIYR